MRIVSAQAADAYAMDVDDVVAGKALCCHVNVVFDGGRIFCVALAVVGR